MGDNKIKSYGNFLNEKEDLPKVTWDRILFGKSIKEILYDIYSEINPVLKWKKMEKYHKELKDSVEKDQKELEERKKILKELEDEIAKKNQKSEERGKFVKNFEDEMGKFNENELPIYNPYSVNDQMSEICPDCGEKENLQLLGPKDYIRDEHGDYRRTLGYQCGKCKSVFSVDKK